MSIKNKYRVLEIVSSDYKDWLLHKHYAHRMPMAVEYAYGLYDETNCICGVCIFGPSAPPVPITLFGKIRLHKVRELTRLVVNDNLEKNTLSYFVAECLKILPKPMCIISFADSGNGHHGYIYQATNWIYTGTGGGSTNIIDSDGKPVHNITITDGCTREKINRKQYMNKHNLSETKAKPKYRYVYFLGNKQEKKQMRKDLLLKQLKYPKGDNERYDASYEPDLQPVLF